MWAKILNIILGLWLMTAPAVFSYGKAASDNGHIIGPIIITFSVVSLWEATHVVRKWNYPFALWLLLSPWLLDYQATTAISSDIITGVLIMILSTVGQHIENRYGGGWSALLDKEPEHIEHAQKRKIE
ncbi:SPW repeat protein [Pricia sp. S334]|uniref:SPW repeat protein n=1 Tax=Pricia mediterranea TaxID=3076079 RepID=A0ABU3L1J7_9FLAO|nr:SPW repeat protein [Pricia sp. S334]MDT7827605.1 SPW repeat protein [Pricia sp. S334]